jgi:alpha 1,3-glucosidase
MWDESFSGSTDTKPKGPSAIAMDFTFVNTDNVYGIPEHADRFSLVNISLNLFFCVADAAPG